MTSLTDFFKLLGAPLVNSRWSWGAQRPSDGAVFLRVWQDLKRFEGEQRFMLLDRHGNGNDPEASSNLGYQERRRHIEEIRAGKRCYLVMCIAKDTEARPRAVREFHDEDIFVGGKIVQDHSGVWIEVVARQPVGTVL